MNRAKLLAASLVLLGAFTASARDYHYLGFKMANGPTNPFEYFLDSRAQNAGGVTVAEAQAATNLAFRAWQDVPCASTAFSYQGLTSNNLQIADPRDPYDLFNVSTIWITDPQDPYYDYALAGGIGYSAAVFLTYGGNLFQCDIYMNAVNGRYSVSDQTASDKDDLATHLIHEIGHCQGLDDVFDAPGSVMTHPTRGVQRRVLDAYDSEALCLIYPMTGAVGSPCPNGNECGDGGLSCIRPPKTDGGPGAAICSQGCQPTEPNRCPAPYACQPSTLIPTLSGACMPTNGNYVTQVGKGCTSQSECGSSYGICQLENMPSTLPSGRDYWEGGYCTQVCGTGQPDCPNGSQCVDFGGSVLRCIQTCRLGTGDCRGGYACVRPVLDSPAFCLPACYSDLDCGSASSTGSVCRICDGICIRPGDASARIGDLCTSSQNCGAGQECLKGLDDRGGICSQTCADSCTACPVGSSCRPVDGQAGLYCLRDCTVGSCPIGMRCGLVGNGRTCLPGCKTSNECAVGTACINGECVDQATNCTLCGGGTPPVDERPHNGGVGTEPVPDGPTPSACACSAGASDTAGIFGLLLTVWVSRRGRRRSS